MKRMRGGSEAQPGFYWNVADWQIVTVEREPRALPGGSEQEYLRVPAPAMLLVAPVLGLSFVVFLPFVGFALVARQVGRKMMQAAHLVAVRLWPEEAKGPAPAEGAAARRRFRS